MGDSLVIQTQGLGKVYGDVVALRSLDLAVPRQAICGFLGPNGAGKTTTMKLLLGLSRPTSGRGAIFGLDIGRDSLTIRERVGYLPQQPSFYETLTARETLRFTAGLFFSGSRAGIDAKVDEMLALVGLTECADRPVRGFSGGEKQRLGIAQAQINDPELLILDEPAAALDPLGRRDVLAIMERLRERTTIFYSTHILNDVQQVSDTVVILNRGELVTQGPIEALLMGDGHAVYSVVVGGETEAARESLARQRWVAGIVTGEQNGRLEWKVSVSDPAAAEEQLLRVVLAHPGVTVSAFNRRRFDLEEIFVNLVEGGQL
jgi:ABC-2 type transport system ATP-binding protein